MRLENLTFPESVERLAGEAGLMLPESSPREVQVEKKGGSLSGYGDSLQLFSTITSKWGQLSGTTVLEVSQSNL